MFSDREILELIAEELEARAVSAFALVEWSRGGFGITGPRRAVPWDMRKWWPSNRPEARRARRFGAARPRILAVQRRSRQKHAEKIRAYARLRRAANLVAERARVLAYAKANRAKINARRRQLHAERKGLA